MISQLPTVPLTVLVASLGRPDSLKQLLDCLRAQTVKPKQIIFSVETQSDIEGLADAPGVEFIFGERGSCHQRNRGLDAVLPSIEFVAIFDDDYVPSKFALEGIVAAFRAFPDAAGVNGKLLRDGIKGPGISQAEAANLVAAAEKQLGRAAKNPNVLREPEGLYGCNMAFRMSALNGQRFDEALPLYAWLEDVDFGARLNGKCIQTDAFYGVHRGEKRGRERDGRLFGYSQIANPIYLRRKGTISWYKAWRLMTRNILANHAKSLKPEPWIDRKGRAIGNWMAIFHLLTFRLKPNFILSLAQQNKSGVAAGP